MFYSVTLLLTSNTGSIGPAQAAARALPRAAGGTPLALTVSEAAQLLQISRASAYEAVRQGSIPSIRIGRTLRVPRAALEAMLTTEGAQS